MRLSIILLGLALAACGSANKQDITDVVKTPSVQPPQESQDEFERRCARGNQDRVPGLLRSRNSVCLIQIGIFVKSEYKVDAFAEQQKEALQAVPAGGVIYGDYDGPSNGPEILSNNNVIGKGQIPLTLVPAAGKLTLILYAGSYKRINYVSGSCFSRGNAYIPCPMPLNP